MDPERIAALWAELMQRPRLSNASAPRAATGARWSRTYLGCRHAPRGRRHPSQHGDRLSARSREPGRRPDAGRADPARWRRSSSSRRRPATSRSRAPSRRRSRTGSTIRPPASRRGSSRSSAPGATATATSRAASRKDELLTNIMLYWVPETANSSCRLYCETMRAAKFPPTNFRVEVPTGCALFPREIIRPPRAWVEKALQRHALDADAARRSLRRHGGARPAGRRRPRVLQRRALDDRPRPLQLTSLEASPRTG